MLDVQTPSSQAPSRQPTRHPKWPKALGPHPVTPEVQRELAELRPKVINIVRGNGDGVSFRAIARALGRNSGQAHATSNAVPHSRVVMLLNFMCVSRELVRIIRMHETRYRLPTPGEEWGAPVRKVRIPRFRPATLRRLVVDALRARPRGCVKAELVSLVHESCLHANNETVTEALDDLMRRGHVRAVPFGAFCRYEAVRAS